MNLNLPAPKAVIKLLKCGCQTLWEKIKCSCVKNAVSCTHYANASTQIVPIWNDQMIEDGNKQSFEDGNKQVCSILNHPSMYVWQTHDITI